MKPKADCSNWNTRRILKDARAKAYAAWPLCLNCDDYCEDNRIAVNDLVKNCTIGKTCNKKRESHAVDIAEHTENKLDPSSRTFDPAEVWVEERNTSLLLKRDDFLDADAA